MLTKVDIDGTTVTTKLINWELEKTYGDTISEIELKFVKGVNDLVTIQTGQTLEVWRGWSVATEEKIFDGYIEKFEPEAGTVKITGLDKLWDLVRKEVNTVYDSGSHATAGVISDIFDDLVTTYGGLSTTSSTIQSSGSTLIIQKFVCNHTDIFERCKALAEALDWQFYYNSDDGYVYFEPKGYTTNSTTLTIGSNVYNLPRWQYDNTEMANDITFVGGYQEVETTESGQIGVTAGYTTTGISIDYEPISVKVYGDAANPPTTLKTGGLPDSSSSYDYYVDKDQKKILPAIGTTFTGNDFYEIRYSAAAPIPITLYRQKSIDTYGLFTKTITLKDIRSVVDAEQRGNEYLDKYSQPFTYATLYVKNDSTYNLAVGQKIRVIDSKTKPNVDDIFVINRLRIKYPSNYDELDVGDRFWRLADFQSKTLEKLKRLEESEFQNQDLINKRVDILNSDDDPLEKENRYLKLLTQTVSGTNCFIFGNADYGKFGTGKFGDNDVGSETINYLRQYNNSYTETFIDTDFKDTVNTTADWDTTNKYLDFTSGEVAYSDSVDYNNGTITTATLTVTIDSGTFDLYMTADGTNWESVTSGTAHTFTDTGTDLRWRIDENAASTGRITEVTVTNYH